MKAIIVDSLPTYKVNQSMSTVVSKCKYLGYWLVDPDITADSKLQMLTEADHYYDFTHAGYKRVDRLILIPTIYGCVLSGTYQSCSEDVHADVVTVVKLAMVLVEVISRQDKTPTKIKDLTALGNWIILGLNLKRLEERRRKRG